MRVGHVISFTKIQVIFFFWYHDISWCKHITPSHSGLQSRGSRSMKLLKLLRWRKRYDWRFNSQKRSSSVLFNYFGYKRGDTEQTTIICKECKKAIISKGGNPSNLFHNLKHQHLILVKSQAIKEWAVSETVSLLRGQ